MEKEFFIIQKILHDSKSVPIGPFSIKKNPLSFKNLMSTDSIRFDLQENPYGAGKPHVYVEWIVLVLQ